MEQTERHPGGCPRCDSPTVSIVGGYGRWTWVTCSRCTDVLWQLPADLFASLGRLWPSRTVTLPPL